MQNSLLIPLVLRFRNQDMCAFNMIYDEFKRLIYHYSGKLWDDDAVGELTLFLIELLYSAPVERFPPDETDSFKRYIAVAIKHKYIALLKDKLKNEHTCDILESDFFEEDILSNISVKEALKCLSSKQRIIIVYKYFYCLPDSQIAQILGITRQAVNRLKNRALSLLKEFYIN